MLSYEQARNKVIEEIGKKRGPRATAVVSVWDALGLVLAQEVRTDREYPPFDRSTRDGYAVRSKEAAPGAKGRLVGILSTGDEVVIIDEVPGEFQIRNSNSVSLAAQVRIAGGEPVILGNAADRIEDLGAKIERGLKEDALVLSGGVSMGKYDLVESVLKAMGAEFFFDAVAIRPGKPAVFGMCQGKPVFGLPGNPVSTMVTFELFVAPAIDLLSGAQARALPLVEARLAEALRERPRLP